MANSSQEPSERAPLLPKSAGRITENEITNAAIANSAPNVAQPPGEDEENQGADGPPKAQSEGNPEVRQRLKYILPAVGIGSRLMGELAGMVFPKLGANLMTESVK
ncbi:MAG: hypothetical protein M1819_007282 [Sarea resinae]|nr:MAG: hypothetical protein M1819_007282 [Sarea resinae]